MTSSIIEQTRLLHQDLENHLNCMTIDLCEDNKLAKDRILQEHRVKTRLEKMKRTGQQLVELYDDSEGGPRKTELEEMTGDEKEVFSRFYEKLKDIRDYYRKFPEVTVKEADYEVKPKVKFSGSEVGGMFVDLHPFFEKYVNNPMFKRCDYLSYLLKFDKFHGEFPQKLKFYPGNFTAYKEYLQELYDYLSSFQLRTNPLVDINELVAMADAEFDATWAANLVPGWTDADSQEAPATNNMDSENPLYCKPCQKLFTKSSTFTNHLEGRKHKKAVQDEGQEKPRDPRAIDLARLEFRIKAFSDLLREVIDATRDHVLKKQTRTYDEIAADLEEQQEEVAVESSEEEEEEAAPYNPLNLPLGWDGKPIPFWLYKLHGLNIEYKCDICAGYTYRGPRAYERHFSEWRHTYGLRCLGINNSKDYLHITKFEDAIALNERLQARDAVSGWKPEEEEEFEDAEGNVFDKKNYDQLKRQGLI